MLLPEDQLLLARAGDLLRKAYFVAVILDIFFSGMLVFLFLYILALHLGTSGKPRQGRKLYILCSFVICAAYATSAALEAYIAHELLWQSTSPLHYIAVFANHAVSWQSHTSSALISLTTAVANAVLLHRCYLIWYTNRWVCIPPTLLFLATVALDIASSALPVTNTGVERALGVCSPLVSPTITAFIAFRLFRAQSDLKAAMPGRSVSLYTRLARMLIEAAAVPGVLGIVLLGFSWAPDYTVEADRWKMVPFGVIGALFSGSVALAPLLIILRVQTGRSSMDGTHLGPVPRRDGVVSDKPPSAPLRFAASNSSHADESPPTSPSSLLTASPAHRYHAVPQADGLEHV